MKNLNLENVFEQCLSLKNQIKNQNLRDCCEKILMNYKDKLMKKPASLGSYHYFRGGLLYHIYCVTRNAISIMDLYSHLKIDSDLIIFGALLHDISKADEYTDFLNNYADSSSNGEEFLGLLYQSTHIVDCYLSKYELDKEFKNQVLHVIAALGEQESMISAKMIEATIVHYADSMDRKLSSVGIMFNKAKKGAQFSMKEEEGDFYKSLNNQYENTWYFE